MVDMYHSFLIHLSADGHLGGFVSFRACRGCHLVPSLFLLATSVTAVAGNAAKDIGVVGFSAMFTVSWVAGFAIPGGKKVREV